MFEYCMADSNSSFPTDFFQCSSQSDPTSASQQVQLLLEEKQQVEAHNHQVYMDLCLIIGFCV